MKSLCFLVALMAVVIASSESESEGLTKRLIGGSGLIGGLLPTELVGNILGKGGLIGGFLGLEEGGFLPNLVDVIQKTVSEVVKTVAALLESLTKGLEGKTEEEDVFAVFDEYPLESLCGVCDDLPTQEQRRACDKYCYIRLAQQ